MSGNGCSITISPAYGRDYKTAADAEKAWNENKDFALCAVYPFTLARMGSYVNRSDQEQYLPGAEIRIRYNRKSDLLILEGK